MNLFRKYNHKLLNMKRVLLLLTTLALSGIVHAQNIHTPPEIKVESIYTNPQKRKPSIAKDGKDSLGIRYIWGVSRLSYVGMNPDKNHLHVSLMGKVQAEGISYHIVFTAINNDVPIRTQNGTAVLLKYSDGTIMESKNEYDGETRITLMQGFGSNYNRYDVTIIAPVSESDIHRMQIGLSKIRVIIDGSNYDVTLKKDNISSFLLQEYDMIKERAGIDNHNYDDF